MTNHQNGDSVKRPAQLWTLDRITSNCRVNESGCLIWQGKLQNRGYGYVWHDGGHWLSHRLVWTLAREPIPSGLTIDHLCRTRACQNVEHMDVVTLAENHRRRVEAFMREVGHCPHGHEYTPENAARNSQGWLYCRTCERERRQARNRTKKEAA